MNTHRVLGFMMALAGVSLLAACSSDSSDSRDMTPPLITTTGITASPTDCQQFRRGEEIPFSYVFTDDTELGNFNIEIHNNFEHHTHSTSPSECQKDPEKEPVNPWVYNQDFEIPAGQLTYHARVNIRIPADVDTGDYHFMVRVTDRAGWQQLRSVAVKVVE